MILDDENIFVDQLSNTNAFNTLYENFNDYHIVHDCLDAIGFLCESPLMIQCQTLNVIKIQRVNKTHDLLFYILKNPVDKSIQVYVYSTTWMNCSDVNSLGHKLVYKYNLKEISSGIFKYNYINENC